MSTMHCPYCEIKEDATMNTYYEALQPIEGRCPDCGAYLDRGQTKVEVNGYIDTYKGAIKLLNEMVKHFNTILDMYDIPIEDYTEDGESAVIRFNTSDIIDKLFIPYSGGTTKSNFKNALGIEEGEIEFEIKRECHWD